MQGRGRCRMLYVAGQLTQTPWGPLAERYEHGKRLRASVAVAARAAKLSNKRAQAIAAATVEAYRSRVLVLAKLSPLEIWHSKIALAREIKRIEARSLRKKLSAIVSKTVGHLEEDDNFPHLVKAKKTRVADR